MPLLQLPYEMLAQVFDYLDPSFFHQNLGRLTVCKLWFEFARPVCYRETSLSEYWLRRLITLGNIQQLSPIQDSLEALQLDFSGFQSWISTTNQAILVGDEVREVLHNVLAQLAAVAQQSRRLTVLRIRADVLAYLPLFKGPDACLLPPAILPFLSLQNLSVLVLDLDTSFANHSSHRNASDHICPAIGTLLGTLEKLQIRMRNICPDILRPRDTSGSLRLRSVVINLSLYSSARWDGPIHSRSCYRETGILQLKNGIQKQAEALAPRMASPKTIRILTSSLPGFYTQSLDVLSGKMMILERNQEWHEDGKVVEEDSESESDFSDEAFAAFADPFFDN
ncbi:hypothetical protein G7046_g3598 [Stylonectria norvegica]|nr:hypothetical protein G7046_g3598 [Stylonectria norvegica]